MSLNYPSNLKFKESFLNQIKESIKIKDKNHFKI